MTCARSFSFFIKGYKITEIVCALLFKQWSVLSRNYRLIVAPQKFDVLKTNICPGSEASRANMLVLRTSNFQMATIRSIVPRHNTLSSLFLTTKFFFRPLVQVQKSIRLQLNRFQLSEMKAVKTKLKI